MFRLSKHGPGFSATDGLLLGGKGGCRELLILLDLDVDKETQAEYGGTKQQEVLGTYALDQ